MALIKCPDCKTKVSSNAENCPQCGCPVYSRGHVQASGGKIQTIEKTRKRYKMRLAVTHVIGVIALVYIAVVLLMDGEGREAEKTKQLAIGAAVAGFNALLFVHTRLMIWWHHE